MVDPGKQPDDMMLGKSKKKDKNQQQQPILPNLNVQIFVEGNKIINKDDSDYSDQEGNLIIKLPKLKIKNIKGGNLYNSNGFYKKPNNFNKPVNISNTSLEIPTETVYSKPVVKGIVMLPKKINDVKFKKSYVSPYSQKMINNHVKI